MKALAPAAISRTLSSVAQAITGIMMFSWNCPPAAPQRAIVWSLPITRAADLHQAFAQHRIDLAGHDRAARLAVGQLDLVEPAARARRPASGCCWPR